MIEDTVVLRLSKIKVSWHFPVTGCSVNNNKILTHSVVGCPVIVHDADGDTIVGSVTDYFPSDSDPYCDELGIMIDNEKGVSAFSSEGSVELIKDDEKKSDTDSYWIPYAVVVERTE